MNRSLFIKLAGISIIIGAIINQNDLIVIPELFICIGLIGLYFHTPKKPDFLLLSGILLKIFHFLIYCLLFLITTVNHGFSTERLSNYQMIQLLLAYFVDIASLVLISLAILIRKSIPWWIGAILLISIAIPWIFQTGNIVQNACFVIIGDFLIRGRGKFHIPNKIQVANSNQNPSPPENPGNISQ
jgi:hypothetical protein